MNQSKQDQRKTQILNAALDVIVTKGYDQCRMDDIVKITGLSKGAIYWYYKSKNEIFLSLINFWVHKYGVVLNHIVEENNSASEQLKDLFKYFSDQYVKDPKVFKALLEFWTLAGRDIEYKHKLQSVYSEFVSLIENIIRKGVSNGEFKHVNPGIAALSIMVNIEGISWFTLFETPETDAVEYIETISEFILAGLMKKSQEDM